LVNEIIVYYDAQSEKHKKSIIQFCVNVRRPELSVENVMNKLCLLHR